MAPALKAGRIRASVAAIGGNLYVSGRSGEGLACIGTGLAGTTRGSVMARDSSLFIECTKDRQEFLPM
jgi:hypothetical protein